MKKQIFAVGCLLALSALCFSATTAVNQKHQTEFYNDVGIVSDFTISEFTIKFRKSYDFDMVFIVPETACDITLLNEYGITVINKYENYRKLQEYKRQFFNRKI